MAEAVANEINRGFEVKKLLQTVSGVLALALMTASNAQTYPNKPVRFLVGFAAGGPTDVAMRTFASKMSEIWGQNLVVENHGGAGGIVAAEIANKAQADGYTLLMCGLAHVISPALYKKLSFDHIRDFAPISTIGTVPNILVVNNSLPATTVGEFISYAKANPGKINYGSSGVGASPHLTMELFRAAAGINVVHVPYKGTGPAMADLLGGHVVAMFDNLGGQVAAVKSGRVRALGITTLKRSAQLPEVPTIAESGLPGFEVMVWYGMCAPAAVPEPVLAKLNADVLKALATSDLQQRLTEQGVDAAPMTRQAFTGFIKSETAKWAKAVKDSGATAE